MRVQDGWSYSCVSPIIFSTFTMEGLFFNVNGGYVVYVLAWSE